MTRKEIFITAWTIARSQAAKLSLPVRSLFGAALRSAWAQSKAPLKPVVSIAGKLDALAGIVIQWPSNLRGTFAFRFICDNANRAEKYGDKARFSDKQITIINEMYAKYA